MKHLTFTLELFAFMEAAEESKRRGGAVVKIDDVLKKGIDILSPYKVGNLALPRLHEVAAAINRIREHDWK